MHSTQPLLNRAENHSKAMNLKLLVLILCALVAVLSVLVGDLYHRQNQYRELLTNEAPVSKQIAVRSMTPMVMNHQTMFEGTHMDLSKIVAEEFTEDSAQYLMDLYKKHFGEDDFEEMAVGMNGETRAKVKGFLNKFKDKLKGKNGVGIVAKVMQMSIYALIRAMLVGLYKINLPLNQVTAGTSGVNLQFVIQDPDKTLVDTLIETLVAKAEKAKTESVAKAEKANKYFQQAAEKVYTVAAKALGAYRHFVCNTGLRIKGFQFTVSTTAAIGINVLLESDLAILKVYDKQFDTDLSIDGSVAQCKDVSTDLVDGWEAQRKEFEDKETYFPFEDTTIEDAIENGKDDKQS